MLPFDATAEAWADDLLASSSDKPVVPHQSGRGLGREAVAHRALRRCGAGAGRARQPRAGECRAPVKSHWPKRWCSIQRARSRHCFHSLERLIAVTRRIALLVAGDTGPLHLACALGKPVVGIYGPTDPSRNGPFGTEFRVLRNPQSVRDHTRYEAPEAGLLTIQPEDVLRAADELLYSEAAS